MRCDLVNPYGCSKWMIEQILADLAVHGAVQAIQFGQVPKSALVGMFEATL